jgi:hypothetical protein
MTPKELVPGAGTICWASTGDAVRDDACGVAPGAVVGFGENVVVGVVVGAGFFVAAGDDFERDVAGCAAAFFVLARVFFRAAPLGPAEPTNNKPISKVLIPARPNPVDTEPSMTYLFYDFFHFNSDAPSSWCSDVKKSAQS